MLGVFSTDPVAGLLALRGSTRPPCASLPRCSTRFAPSCDTRGAPPRGPPPPVSVHFPCREVGVRRGTKHPAPLPDHRWKVTGSVTYPRPGRDDLSRSRRARRRGDPSAPRAHAHRPRTCGLGVRGESRTEWTPGDEPRSRSDLTAAGGCRADGRPLYVDVVSPPWPGPRSHGEVPAQLRPKPSGYWPTAASPLAAAHLGGVRPEGSPQSRLDRGHGSPGGDPAVASADDTVGGRGGGGDPRRPAAAAGPLRGP